MVALALGLGFLALVWYRIEAFRYLASRVRLGPMLLHSGAKGMSGVGRMLLVLSRHIGVAIALGIGVAILGMIAVPIKKAALPVKPWRRKPSP